MQTVAKYPLPWRILHWVISLSVIVLIPVGLWMASRGAANIWDGLTNTLYTWHKAIGFTVLLLMLVRIALKVGIGTPPYPADMPRGLVIAANAVHHTIYVLLIAVPLLGWAGVTAYPALVTVGGYNLPAMPFVPQSQALAKQLFQIHGFLALTLGALALLHIAAALKHLLINRDGVFQRMT